MRFAAASFAVVVILSLSFDVSLPALPQSGDVTTDPIVAIDTVSHDFADCLDVAEANVAIVPNLPQVGMVLLCVHKEENMSQGFKPIVVVLVAIVHTVVGCRTPPTLSESRSTSFRPVAQTETFDSDSQVQLVSVVQEVAEDLPSPLETVEDGEVLTLSDAIRLAFEASPDLVSAAEQIAAADASLARARAEFYPRLGVSEQYGVSNNPGHCVHVSIEPGAIEPDAGFQQSADDG